MSATSSFLNIHRKVVHHFLLYKRMDIGFVCTMDMQMDISFFFLLIAKASHTSVAYSSTQVDVRLNVMLKIQWQLNAICKFEKQAFYIFTVHMQISHRNTHRHLDTTSYTLTIPQLLLFEYCLFDLTCLLAP